MALRYKDKGLLLPYLEECKSQILWCDRDGNQGDFCAKDVILGRENSRFLCEAADEKIEVSLPFAGSHYIDNALLVIAVALAIGIAKEDIQMGLANAVSLSSNRMEMHELSGGRLLINDCYNANPDSMIATLDVLAGYKPRATIACLGNMYELGDYEKSGHESVGSHLAKLGIDYLICLGNKAEYIGNRAIQEGMDREKVYYVDSTKQAAYVLSEYMPENGVVLVKGSNSMNMAEVLKNLKPLLS